MPFSLNWMGDATDADCVSFTLSQTEGDFAHLSIEIRNPRVGLLAEGRELWATLSHDIYGDLFYGRLVGVPTDIQADAVQLEFLARPEDFDEQKAALAETLKVLPFYDPVFVAPEDREKPDTVLEARPVLWHIDRLTGEVTISDIMSGEDGTIIFAPERTLSVSVSYDGKPATLAACKAEVRWTQRAEGSIDISQEVLAAFEAADSTRAGHIASFTGEGLYKSWPKIGASIGGGWEIGASSIERLDGVSVPFLNLNVACSTGGFKTNVTSGNNAIAFVVEDVDEAHGWIPLGETYTGSYGFPRASYYEQDDKDIGGPCIVGFPEWVLEGTLGVKFTADRVRSEQVSFSIAADVQPIVSDMTDAAVSIDVRTGEVDQPIDPGGAIPIGDPRRNSYMLTDRGKQSLEHLIVLCRARLLARARAVRVSFDVPFEDGAAASLRHSATIADPRLPGGQATGKVVSYSFSLNGDDGALNASLTIGCMIGHNGTLSAPAAGAPAYATGYVETGYQVSIGSASGAATGDIQWTDYGGTAITLGGLDLFGLSASGIIDSLEVLGGSSEQADILSGQTWHDTNEATTALNDAHTQVALALVPVTGDELKTPFEITVTDLMVPKTIDLEAASA